MLWYYRKSTTQGADGFNPNPGGIAAHHIAAGIFGIFAGVFHLTVRPRNVYTVR
jgi:hypothetical protein